MKQWIFAMIAVVCAFGLSAQNNTPVEPVPTGAWAYMEVSGKDTTFLMSLRPVRIADKRPAFKDSLERIRYLRYKIAARKVYPFAIQAVDLYETIQEETADMSKRKRKRFIRKEHKEVKEDFSDKLKELSRTQGRVLIKMIEREVGKPFYEVIRETRGGAMAVYWHQMGKMFDYNLKEGYQEGADMLLDEVLLDYDFGR
jgi:Domain of unknown function (DUF4294)